jgi:dihydrofolate synthase/folylpolyglutamate synthase
VWASDWPVEDLTLTALGSRFRARHLEIECPLAGEHQVTNALTAAIVLDLLEVPIAGIRETRWPGRLEIVRRDPDIILDGAHNPSGARALARYIERFYADKRVCLIYAAMRDKAVEEVAAILFPMAGTVIATAPAQSRAVRPEVIRQFGDNVVAAPRLADALKLIGDAEAVFVTGSLFLVGEARSLLVQ